MVAPLTLISLTLATLFVGALPIVIYLRLRQPLKLDRRDAIAGIGVFALFAMLIERGLNGYVFQNPTTAGWLSNPVVFVAYGSLAAGVCEEVGRFIAMKLMFKRAAATPGAIVGTRTADGTALAYGVGHGGAEAWLVGVVVQVQWIFFAVLSNRGELDTHLSSIPIDALIRVHLILSSLSPGYAAIFVLERVAALVFQIALSVLMWRGVRAGWRGILPLGIAAHALIALPAALFQGGVLPLLAVDGIYGVAALGVAALLIKLFRSSWREARAV